MANFEDKKLIEQWKYQQKFSIERIRKISRLLLINIPFGYLEIIVYIFFTLLTLPIILAEGLFYWLEKALLIKIKLEDLIESKLDNSTKKCLEK